MLLRLTPAKRSITVGDVAESLGWSLRVSDLKTHINEVWGG